MTALLRLLAPLLLVLVLLAAGSRAGLCHHHRLRRRPSSVFIASPGTCRARGRWHTHTHTQLGARKRKVSLNSDGARVLPWLAGRGVRRLDPSIPLISRRFPRAQLAPLPIHA
jgi:hypothetical protein